MLQSRKQALRAYCPQIYTLIIVMQPSIFLFGNRCSIDAVCLLFYYIAGTSKLKTVHLQGFYQNSVSQVFWDQIKNRASSRLLAKNRVSQVFLEPIKNRVSPRSVLLEAVYLEALLYLHGKTHQKVV